MHKRRAFAPTLDVYCTETFASPIRLTPQTKDLNSGSARFLTATRLRPPAQGWAAADYPGIRDEKQSFNRKAVASFPRRIKTGATALRLGLTKLVPRVAEAATLGWMTQPRCGSALSEMANSSQTLL